MAQWVFQSEFSSITAAARSRTAYLTPMLEIVLDAIRAYLREDPQGEEITLFVLKTLGRERLRSFSKERSFHRVKQDVGLLVPQALVDSFGAMRVQTLRRDDRKAPSARRNTWADLHWVNSATPHRVLPASAKVERILLDTSVVRKYVHGDSDALDVESLAGYLGEHPVSIADGALVELANQLFRGSVSAPLWTARIAALDKILDTEFPVAPGGRELAALWGGGPPVGMDIGEARSFYRAAWGHLRNMRGLEDLSRPSIFSSPSGRAYSLHLDRAHVERVLAAAGKKWADWVTRVGRLISDLRGDGKDIDESAVRYLARATLLFDSGVSDATKLDLVVQILAKRAIQAANRRTPYNPKGVPNDPLDLDLFYGIPLPAWICTSDLRLHRLVQSTDSPDETKVMTPAELLKRLKTV
jgi:hypothetical protein